MSPARAPVLNKILAGITEAIARGTHSQLGLLDPLTGEPTPRDHYGQTFAALTMCSLAPPAAEKREDALRAWLRTSNRDIDHLPFNRLALSLMLNLHHKSFSETNQALVLNGIARCRLEKNYPSNNWTLLAATCRLIDTPVEHRPEKAQALAEMLQRWTTTKGAFIDFPSKPKGAICTPIAYHHKALFLAALALRFCSHSGLAHQTRRLFSWIVHCWDEAGYAGGFGRSNHSLFGDACLIAALILLDVDENGPVNRIANRLLHQMRPDGFLWLDPWGTTDGSKHWDSYMHLSVYNAWAAGIIQSARRLQECAPISPHLNGLCWQANQPGLHHDDEAGLASWRDEEGNVVLFSTRGQPPQVQSQHTVDLRYAGGRIYHLRIASSTPRLMPGYRESLDSLSNNPTQAGATPILANHAQFSAVDTFENSQLKQTSDGFIVELEGHAHHLTPPAPHSAYQRALAGIDWRFLDGRLRRAMILRRTSIPGLSAELIIQMTKSLSTLTLSRRLYLPSSIARWCLNPRADQFSAEIAHSRTRGKFTDSRGSIRATDKLSIHKSEEVYDLTTGALLNRPL